MASEHDLTIYWGDRPTYNRHKVALEIQDAGNMRAIAREFVKVVDAAMAEHKSTEATWRDAAVVLLVNKLESLSRSEHDYGRAYVECKAKASA